MKVLLIILICLFAGLYVIGIGGLEIWLWCSDPKYRDALAKQGINPEWWTIYTTSTLITDCELTLTPDSMMPFRDAPWPMMLGTFLVKAGNIFHPIILRFIIWAMWRILSHKRLASEKNRPSREPLRCLLDNSRKFYTMLFSSKDTCILFSTLVTLTGIDTIFIVTTDLDNEELTVLFRGQQFCTALFQAGSPRHARTAVFTLAKVNPAVLINQVVMFFIAVLPIVVIIRMTDESRRRAMNLVSSPRSWRGYLGQASHYIEQQMSFDLSFIIICIFIICWIESDSLKDKTTFNLFAVLFECVSPYTNVGLSLGAFEANTSLSRDFHPASKIVLCVAMWRGRHRVLADNGDPTVRLPSDRVSGREDEARSPE